MLSSYSRRIAGVALAVAAATRRRIVSSSAAMASSVMGTRLFIRSILRRTKMSIVTPQRRRDSIFRHSGAKKLIRRRIIVDAPMQLDVCEIGFSGSCCVFIISGDHVAPKLFDIIAYMAALKFGALVNKYNDQPHRCIISVDAAKADEFRAFLLLRTAPQRCCDERCERYARRLLEAIDNNNTDQRVIRLMKNYVMCLARPSCPIVDDTMSALERTMSGPIFVGGSGRAMLIISGKEIFLLFGDDPAGDWSKYRVRGGTNICCIYRFLMAVCPLG